MAIYNIVVLNERKWKKDISKISKDDMRKIKNKIFQLAENPFPDSVDVKKVQTKKVATFRLKVGGYRVLFERDETKKCIYLAGIKSRSKAYRS